MVLKYPAVAGMLDMVNVMSYDARFEHYDGVTAYNQYRSLFPSRTIVSIGLESAPEGWAGVPGLWGAITEQAQAAETARAMRRARREWPWLTSLAIAGGPAPIAATDPRRGFALWRDDAVSVAACPYRTTGY